MGKWAIQSLKIMRFSGSALRFFFILHDERAKRYMKTILMVFYKKPPFLQFLSLLYQESFFTLILFCLGKVHLLYKKNCRNPITFNLLFLVSRYDLFFVLFEIWNCILHFSSYLAVIFVCFCWQMLCCIYLLIIECTDMSMKDRLVQNRYSKGLHKSIRVCFTDKVYKNSNSDYQDSITFNSAGNMII